MLGFEKRRPRKVRKYDCDERLRYSKAEIEEANCDQCSMGEYDCDERLRHSKVEIEEANCDQCSMGRKREIADENRIARFDARMNNGGNDKILTHVRHGAAARLLERSHAEGRRPGQLDVGLTPAEVASPACVHVRQFISLRNSRNNFQGENKCKPRSLILDFIQP